jgi:hypothetical protein
MEDNIKYVINYYSNLKLYEFHVTDWGDIRIGVMRTLWPNDRVSVTRKIDTYLYHNFLLDFFIDILTWRY